MASLTLRGINDRFAEGTSLRIYPRSNFLSSTPPVPGLAPVGSSVGGAQTVSGDAVTFPGLADDTPYVVTDSTGTKYLQTGTLQPHGQPVKTGSNGRLPGSVLPESEPVDIDQYQIAAASFSAGVQAAITAATAAGTKRGAIAFTPGKTYTNNGSALSLVPNVPGLIVYGNGATIKGTSNSTARRCWDLTRSADNDTFSGYHIYDLTFDRDSLTSVTNEHVFFGSLIGGAWAQRINVSDIRLTRCKTINVPVSTTVAYQNVSIGSKHVASGEGTTNTILDVLVDECDWQGGTYGTVPAVGGCDSVTAGSGVEVMYDRITVRNTKHDPGVTPSASGGGANIQIGGYAWGRKATIEGCYGANSPDVGIEVDNCLQLYVDPSTTMMDSWSENYFVRNFRKPGTGTSPEIQQRNVILGTATSRNVDPVPSGGSVGAHFQVGGDSSTAGYIFGHAIFRGKSVFESALTLGGAVGSSVMARSGSDGVGVRFRQLTVDVDIDAPNMVVNSGSAQTPNFVDVRSLLAGHVVNVEGVHFKLAGSRAGAGAFVWSMVRVHGTDGTHNVRNITADTSGLTGLGAGDTFYWLGFGRDFASTTIKGNADAVRFVTAPSGGTHHGVTFASTTNLAITGLFNVTNCDMEKLAGLSGFDYNIDSTQVAKIAVRNYATSSSRTGGVGNNVASAATLTLPPAGEWINVTGTTNITAIPASWKHRKVTLRFNGVLTVTGGGNLVMTGGTFTTANNSTLTLVTDGTSWWEESRRA